MSVVTASDLDGVLRHCQAQLSAMTALDWDTRVDGMEWTVRDTVEHLVDGVGFFTMHLLSESRQRLRVDVRCHAGIPNTAVLDVLDAQVRAFTRAAELLPPTTSAYHPHGTSDVSGFVAMACAELLLHTDDACRGVGVNFEVDDAVAAALVARLFPHASSTRRGWDTLRWATGRLSLDGHDDVGPGWAYDPTPRQR